VIALIEPIPYDHMAQ